MHPGALPSQRARGSREWQAAEHRRDEAPGSRCYAMMSTLAAVDLNQLTHTVSATAWLVNPIAPPRMRHPRLRLHCRDYGFDTCVVGTYTAYCASAAP